MTIESSAPAGRWHVSFFRPFPGDDFPLALHLRQFGVRDFLFGRLVLRALAAEESQPEREDHRHVTLRPHVVLLGRQ